MNVSTPNRMPYEGPGTHTFLVDDQLDLIYAPPDRHHMA